MSTHHLKHYKDLDIRQRALSNYSWLAGLEPLILLPRLLTAWNGEYVCFEHIEGRHALLRDLTELAAYLGGMHRAAYARELHQARLCEPYRTWTGHTLRGFPDARMDAVARELRAERVPGTRLTVQQARELIGGADGPAVFYKDANPRNFIITPARDLFTIDFDDLSLAPLGYDLAKLVVTLAMTHGPVPVQDIGAALNAYNAATSRNGDALPEVRWEELMSWAEIHHILTIRFAADGRYPYRWDQTRPATRWTGDRTWP